MEGFSHRFNKPWNEEEKSGVLTPSLLTQHMLIWKTASQSSIVESYSCSFFIDSRRVIIWHVLFFMYLFIQFLGFFLQCWGLKPRPCSY
jgi:hypothetical protein